MNTNSIEQTVLSGIDNFNVDKMRILYKEIKYNISILYACKEFVEKIANSKEIELTDVQK